MTQWDITTATYKGSLDVSAQESVIPNGFTFSSDGKKIFMVTPANTNLIYEYATNGFNLATAVFVTAHPAFSAKDIKFSDDGLKMFVLTGNFVSRYNLSTPYNIASRIFHSQKNMGNTASPNGGDSFMSSFWISSDGLHIFTTGYGASAPNLNPSSSDRVYHWGMLPAFDLSTASLFFTTYHTTENLPTGIFLKPDGLHMFVTGAEFQPSNHQRSMHHFGLNPPFNVLPVVTSTPFDISSQVPEVATDPDGFFRKPVGLYFNPTGQRFFYMDQQNQEIDEWTMRAFGLTKTFLVDAFLVKRWVTFTIGARLVIKKQVTFTIGARLLVFCESFSAPVGWTEVDPNNQIFVDDPLFPDTLHFSAINGGGGVTQKWVSKDTGKIVSGDVKLQFYFDYQAMNAGTVGTLEIRFSQNPLHPNFETGSYIGCSLSGTNSVTHHLYGTLSDGTNSITSIQGGTRNQRTTHVYPTNQFGGADPELLGPYWVTVELKSGKFRMSIFKDANRTIHIRGSPREVNATGISPTNLRYINIGNNLSSGLGRSFTGDIDDICIHVNEPLPPLAIPTIIPINYDDWEGHATGDQNPFGWSSSSIQRTTNGGTFDPALIDIHEVSTQQPDTGVKHFKIHTKYQHTGGTNAGSSTYMHAGVLSTLFLTPSNPNGGELLFPEEFNIRLRANIMSNGVSRAGIYIKYNILQGAPLATSPNTFRLLGYIVYNSGGSFAIQGLWNDSTFTTPGANRVPPDQALPLGIYTTVVGNINTALRNDPVIDSVGVDYESHVKSIQIGIYTDTFAQGIGVATPEALLFGDNISFNSSSPSIDFKMDAILLQITIQLGFFVDVILKTSKEFTIDTLLTSIHTPIPFEVGARLVYRLATNSLDMDAILISAGEILVFTVDSALLGTLNREFLVDALIIIPPSVLIGVDTLLQKTQDLTFLVDAVLGNPLEFTVDAVLSSNQNNEQFTIDAILTRQSKFTIDAILTFSIAFLVDAVIGTVSEPQSILDVESVIGHEI